MVCEPVWPSGKALGWQAEGPRFESALALLSLQNVVVCGHCLVTLSFTINETLNGSRRCPSECRTRSGGDSVAIGI